MSRPLPDITDTELAPHWAGLANSIILVPRCLACDRRSWPPRPGCPVCHCLEQDWVEAGNEGTVYSWTVVEHRTLLGFDPPYAVVLVALDEPAGIRLLGGYGTDTDTLRIGLPVRAQFKRITDDITLLEWKPIPPATQLRSEAL